MVEVHEDHFPQARFGEISDEYWIRDVTARDWIILTRNGRIRNNPLERRTFIEARSRVFNVRNGSATADAVAKCIGLAAARMERILKEHSGPFIAGISLNGDISFIDAPETPVTPDAVASESGNTAEDVASN